MHGLDEILRKGDVVVLNDDRIALVDENVRDFLRPACDALFDCTGKIPNIGLHSPVRSNRVK
jgi:hypothetical protein